jgi:glucose-1-phosphate cytidylyltransferase
MKAVILAGGYGTRMTGDGAVSPKPMTEIGGKPILWHVMKIYSQHGIDEFVVCLGYRGHIIKEYFANYVLRSSDVTLDLRESPTGFRVHRADVEPWQVTLVETGDTSMTGGRLQRAAPYLDGETFCATYGDCVADVDITALIRFHREREALATLTAVQPPGRFGAVLLEHGEDRVRSFREKPKGEGGWINGGFFVLEPGALDYIEGDSTVWEREPLERLARDGALAAYRHYGFWQNMDTLRDREVLEEAWRSGAPWKAWESSP